VLHDFLARGASHVTHNEESPRSPRHGLLSVRSAVIFAIATAGGLIAGWSQPGLGLGAWLALVVGLDAIIDRDQLHSR
jgi:hypothetical protein